MGTLHHSDPILIMFVKKYGQAVPMYMQAHVRLHNPIS